MHSGKIIQFERLLREFRAWRDLPDSERAPAAAWWWGTAVALRDESTPMPPEHCGVFGLADGCSYADAAERLIDMIAIQTSLPSPGRFPRKPADPKLETPPSEHASSERDPS